jgi:ribosomal protein S20
MAEVRLPGARELAARAEQTAEKQRRHEAEQRGLITFERRARMRRSLNRLTAASEGLRRGEVTETQSALAEVASLRTLPPDLRTTVDHVAQRLQNGDVDRAAAQLRIVCNALREQLAPRTVESPVLVPEPAATAVASAMSPEARAFARERVMGALPVGPSASLDVHTRIPLNAWLAALHPPKRQMRAPHVAATAALVAVMLGTLTAWRTVRPADPVRPADAKVAASHTRAATPPGARQPALRSFDTLRVVPSVVEGRQAQGMVATTGTKPPPLVEVANRETPAPIAIVEPVPPSVQTPAPPIAQSAATPPIVSAPVEPLANPRAVIVEEVPVGTPLPAPTAVALAPAPPMERSAVRTDAAAASAAVAGDKDQIDRALREYRHAYERLDARAARAVWPGVNERALARAFEGLESQGLNFDRCDVDVADAAATAVCQGSARYVPKVGSKEPQVEPRRWTFKLRKSNDTWEIAGVETGRKD